MIASRDSMIQQFVVILRRFAASQIFDFRFIIFARPTATDHSNVNIFFSISQSYCEANKTTKLAPIDR